MKLSKALDELDYTRPLNNPCGVVTLLKEVADREGVEEVQGIADRLNDPQRLATVLADGLKKHGYTINPATIRRHRKGQCSCR